MRALELVKPRTHRRPLQILALGAHCDDIDIGCGGTMLSLLERHREAEVTWVVMGSNPVRERELRASARRFLRRAGNSQVIVHRFRDGFFPAHFASIKQVFESLKQLPDPDLVFSHHRADLHQDHRVVAELTWNTFRNHLILEYEIPKFEGDLGAPNVFVPLARATADRKVDLLLRHFGSQSARTWFRPDTFNGLMSVRGVECNAPEGRAEAFHARKLT